jgi:tRNA-modifying protein YgfZ
MPSSHPPTYLYDRTPWGRLEFTGADRQAFLHNQTTNDIKRLQPGQGCDTLFVTSTARTIDLATVYVTEEAVLVLVSPSCRERLMQWCDRYIFFGDKVAVRDCSVDTAALSLLGEDCDAVLSAVGVQNLPAQGYANHSSGLIAGCTVQIARGSGLASPGYTLIMSAAEASAVKTALFNAGTISWTDAEWEHQRILQGRPAPGSELTDDYNAIEASLWQAISINKGCYIGQETIARLDTYKGVKQQLWGIQLSQPATPGSDITLVSETGSEKVGTLTSFTALAHPPFGLGYVRTKAGGAGLQVQIDNSIGELVEVPFLQRDRTTL